MYKKQNESIWSLYKKHWKKHPILMTFATIFFGGFVLMFYLIVFVIKISERAGRW